MSAMMNSDCASKEVSGGEEGADQRGHGGRVPRVAVNSVDLDEEELESEDELDAHRKDCTRVWQQNVMTLTPSSVRDFTEEWVLFVMQQYYESNFQESLKEIGKFSAECAAEKPPSATTYDSNENQTEVSQHILSQAFKVMVDVPDPPSEDGIQPAGGGGATSSSSVAVSPKDKAKKKKKIHHLFVKIPPKRTAKFERMVRRNRTLEHEVKVYAEFLKDLKSFVEKRVGDAVTLKIPELYHGYQATDSDGSVPDNHVLIIEDLTKRGFKTRDWFTHKLTHEEVTLAVSELAKFHACGLAYRMSLKEEINDKYPYLEDDLYTSNMAKELLAKYLDSYLHFLSLLPGIQDHVLKLRKISDEVFQLLVKLRKPSDPLGTRFNTVCHGDMWMGNLMFKSGPVECEDGTTKEGVSECIIIDFHSAQFLSPATDLAHLLLTSTTREYRQKHWDEVVESYYNIFNRTLAEFGLILRHLGTTYSDFLYEVKRALRGQFLCVAFIIPIVIYCGPMEWRFERRRGSSSDRKNTIRHLIQMMAIHEEVPDSPDVEEEVPDFEEAELKGIPHEFRELYRDEELVQILIDLMHTAADLDILDFHEFCKHLDTPKPMWSKTQATTGKHKPVY